MATQDSSGALATIPPNDAYTGVFEIVQGTPANLTLVAEARAEVLRSINLHTMLVDLERTGQLLHVASCGVGGAKDTTLSGRVANLQFSLLRASGDAELAMGSFGESAGAVLGALMAAFRYLYANPPREDKTLLVLARCEVHAMAMSSTAAGLAVRFSELAGEAEKALEGTLGERDEQEQVRLAAERRQQELKALDAEARTLGEQIAKTMQEVQALYDEARRAQDKAEDRAFALAIVGSITSAFSSGVAAYSAANASPLTAAASALGAGKGAPTEKVAEKVVDKDKPAAKQDADKQDADKKDADKKDADKKDVDKKDVDKPAAKEDPKSGAAVLKAVAAGAGDIAATTKSMSGGYDDIAARWAAAKDKYLDLKMQLAEQQRKALGELAKYAEQMKAAKGDSTMAESAVQSLQQAIAALKQIVAVLETARRFWDQMAAACKRLASHDFREEIELGLKTDTLAERMAEYRTPYTVRQVLQLAARWYALQLVAKEYEQGVAAARGKIETTYKTALSIEEGRRLAPALGAQLLRDIEQDMKLLDDETRQVKADQAEHRAPKAAAASAS